MLQKSRNWNRELLVQTTWTCSAWRESLSLNVHWSHIGRTSDALRTFIWLSLDACRTLVHSSDSHMLIVPWRRTPVRFALFCSKSAIWFFFQWKRVFRPNESKDETTKMKPPKIVQPEKSSESEQESKSGENGSKMVAYKFAFYRFVFLRTPL